MHERYRRISYLKTYCGRLIALTCPLPMATTQQMNSSQRFLGALIASAALMIAPGFAQTIDGVRDAAYGTPVVVQDTATGFADNTDPSPNGANGSELDALYFTISGGNLNLFVAGNLETNFNRLYIFLDSIGGGQNTLAGQQGSFAALNGMQFDIGFSPDYAFTVNGSATDTFFDFGNLQAMTSTFLGQSVPGSGNGTLTAGTANGVSGSLNNSNVGGVTSSSAAGGETVSTGLELQIPLSLIGAPTGRFTVSAFITGTGGNSVSNQVLPGIGGGGNLGAPSSVNFASIPGDQFVAIPEPSTVSLLGVSAIAGAYAFVRRRRR
jgi:hypothetical protein